MSGARAARPGLTEALAVLQPGDTPVFWGLSRLGRSLKQLIEAVQHLEMRGIEFKMLHFNLCRAGFLPA